MTNQIQQLDQMKYKVFGQCESIAEARAFATDTLKDSHLHDVHAVLDIYHNTLIEQIMQEVKSAS